MPRRTKRLGNILLEKRSHESLTPSVKEAIDIITLDPKYPPDIVGSYKYIIHEYPVDIDLFENCMYTGPSKTVILNRIVQSFKKMAVRVKKARDTYLADFKAGEDVRYECPFLGTFDIIAGLRDYDARQIRRWIHAISHEGLLTEQERDEWLRAVVSDPDYIQYYRLEEMIRKKRIIRWSLTELKRGKKKLSDNVIYTLAEAIDSQTVIKIDIWKWVDRRFVEITNWFRIRYRADVRRPWTDLTQPLPVYEESIKRGVREFLDPNLGKNMKMAKRIWLYAVHTNDIHLMKTLYPIFRSDAARLAQIHGEIEVILAILANVKKPPLSKITNQIIQFNEIISTITQNIIPVAEKKRIFKRIFNSKTQADIISNLTYIDNKLSKYIQRYVYAILKKKHIFARIEKLFAFYSPKARPSGYVLTS